MQKDLTIEYVFNYNESIRLNDDSTNSKKEYWIMKRVYQLEGLDCAVCAGKLEDKVSKLKCVASCNVNFLMLKMTVELVESGTQEDFAEVEATIKKTLPKVKAKRIG